MPHFLLVFFDDPELIGTTEGDAIAGAYNLQDIIEMAIMRAERYTFMDVWDLRGGERKFVYNVYLKRIKDLLEEILEIWKEGEEWQEEKEGERERE